MQRSQIEELFYGKRNRERRFTQDFPILPDVWFAFAEENSGELDPSGRLPLLLTPHNRSSAASLGRALRRRAEGETPAAGKPRILYNESVALAGLSFRELLRIALPLSEWWSRCVAPGQDWTAAGIRDLDRRLAERQPGHRFPGGDPQSLRKLIRIAGAIQNDLDGQSGAPDLDGFIKIFEAVEPPGEQEGLLWSVSRNRRAEAGVWRSRLAVKADAVANLFEVDGSDIRWAVLDTGIDARHEAFAGRPRKSARGAKPKEFSSRVVKTYDFLQLKKLLDPAEPIGEKGEEAGLPPQQLDELRRDLDRSLRQGRAVDWDLLEPFLRVPHEPGRYREPADSHGTHVAGILAADWPDAPKRTSLEGPLTGICPGIELYDLRVLGEGSDEFTVIAALQFVRHLNAHKDLMAIHGVNLSMAVPHDVANFACGRTPVCEECERLVASGVVVVTAAGNRGFNKLEQPEAGAAGDYRYISITDPGNAESVITVGATHRYMPHTYGVSYFSSRGPTGDGRAKPDLVAPGERIDSCAPGNDYETMDGTSMAAPHVSGAAALLMARNRELIGQPRRVKEILCRSATCLGREPRFQGAGMLDILRALQAV